MNISSLKGKKLLILAGAGVHNKVVRAAKEMGIYTIVTDYLENSPAKQLADESWMYSIADVDGIVERCRKEHVDGVLNFCIDPAQLPYLEICERLGFPCYGTRESFSVLTNKRKFKDYCIAHNVDVIPDYTREDILADRVEYPVFIKPNKSRGSRGQSVCFNREEVLKGLETAEKESSDGKYICEKSMAGHRDIGSAFFVVDGEPYLIKFADRYLGSKEDNLSKQVMCTYLPSEFSDKFEANAMPRVKKMIRSLGIQFGPVFLQGFVDGDTVRYYDPGERMPGGDYDLILRETTGFDTVRSCIVFALTGSAAGIGDPRNAFRLNGKISTLFTLSVRPGHMNKIVGLEDILKNPHVRYARQIIEDGSDIPDSGDILQRVAAVGAVFSDKQELKQFTSCLYDTVQALDSNGENMVVSRFQFDGEKGTVV